MENKKQTAVNWLWKELHPKLTFDDILLLVEKAMVIEQEQIIDAFNEGQALIIRGKLIQGEQYYKETYGE
jgi:hypothetical protein